MRYNICIWMRSVGVLIESLQRGNTFMWTIQESKHRTAAVGGNADRRSTSSTLKLYVDDKTCVRSTSLKCTFQNTSEFICLLCQVNLNWRAKIQRTHTHCACTHVHDYNFPFAACGLMNCCFLFFFCLPKLLSELKWLDCLKGRGPVTPAVLHLYQLYRISS